MKEVQASGSLGSLATSQGPLAEVSRTTHWIVSKFALLGGLMAPPD